MLILRFLHRPLVSDVWVSCCISIYTCSWWCVIHNDKKSYEWAGQSFKLRTLNGQPTHMRIVNRCGGGPEQQKPGNSMGILKVNISIFTLSLWAKLNASLYYFTMNNIVHLGQTMVRFPNKCGKWIYMINLLATFKVNCKIMIIVITITWKSSSSF